MISFKNTGISSNSSYFNPKTNPKPVGIKTPIAYSSDNGFFETNTSALAQIKDNFRNLVLTNKGERLGRYDYGSDLRRLVSEAESVSDYESVVMENISSSIQRYLPMIELDSFGSVYVDDTNDELRYVEVTILYNVPRISVFDEKISVKIYIV